MIDVKKAVFQNFFDLLRKGVDQALFTPVEINWSVLEVCNSSKAM